jgi:hypothetical protein
MSSQATVQMPSEAIQTTAADRARQWASSIKWDMPKAGLTNSAVAAEERCCSRGERL